MMDGSQAQTSVETSGSPAEFLKNVVGKQVKVRIGSGIDYEGKCIAWLFLGCGAQLRNTDA